MSKKYKIIDTLSRVEFGELKQCEFESYKQFVKKYKWFENVFFSFELANKSVKQFKDFEKHINSKENKYDINEIHTTGLYHITSLVLFLRLFIVNSKSYSTKVSSECKLFIKKTEKNPSIKILKALRDYSQHYHLPVENTHRVYDIFNETMTTKFIITKSDLLKNKENKRNLAIIEQYPDDEINIGEKIDEWFQSITLLMENILEEFTSNISEETKNILRNKFGWIQSKDKKYFLNSVVEEGEYYPEIYYSTEPRVLNVILMMI